jgi:glycosyltransferase involved in cell wall biosynthesis
MSTILLISPEPWDAHCVSKHHYARELARRGHKVLFYGPPDATGPMHVKHVTDAPGDLSVLHAPRVAPGLRFLPGPLRCAWEARWLKQVEKLVGANIDVVWLFENSRFYDMRFAGAKLKIYHQVDLNQNFHHETAAKTADNVFCTSKLIHDRLAPYTNRLKIIQHGVQIAKITPERESSLFDPDCINCTYVGNLSMKYIDQDLLIRCIKSYPLFLFHFFGGFKDGDPFRNTLMEFNNVVLHGKVDSSRIVSIIANTDISLVTYQKKHFDDQSNPHKVMEYMMGGKVIVATWTMEYESTSNLLAMCRPDEDFVARLGEVAKDIKAWNSPENIERRRAFAADNSYPRQIDRIAQALGPRGTLVS